MSAKELSDWANEEVVPYIDRDQQPLGGWFRTKADAVKIFWSPELVTCILIIEVPSPASGSLVVQTRGVTLAKLRSAIADIRVTKGKLSDV